MLRRSLRPHMRKNTVLLIDSNVVLDFLLRREPFYDSSKRVMRLCTDEYVDGYVALHSLTTIWYLLRNKPDSERRSSLKTVCELLEVVGTTHDEIVNAIDMTEFRDFEDCVLSKCAKAAGADYIVTRNKSDFTYSEIPAVTPDELFSLLGIITTEIR